MKHRKKKLTKIFNELCSIEYLYKTQNQVLQYCCDNNLDCHHITELGELIQEKLRHARNQLDLFALKF